MKKNRRGQHRYLLNYILVCSNSVILYISLLDRLVPEKDSLPEFPGFFPYPYIQSTSTTAIVGAIPKSSANRLRTFFAV
jgi:hypothetical protein